MRTQSLHASLLSSRNSTPLCGTGREGSHRVHEDPDTEAMREFLAHHLRGRAKEIALLVGCEPLRIREEWEGKQRLSRAHEHFGLPLILKQAVTQRGPVLLPSLVPAAGEAAILSARLLAVSAQAEADGRIDDGELAELVEIDTQLDRVKGSVRLTAEVANGMRLIGEVKR